MSSSETRQLALTLAARPEATFENFLTGRNAEALDALRAVAAGGPERFVYLWGASGGGRGHLLHACVQAARACMRHAVYLGHPVSVEALEAISADTVLALADVERLEPAAQQALFAAYNRIREGAGGLVASGSAAPAGLGLRADLSTRLGWGLVYEIHGLSDAEKMQAMTARAAALGFSLPAETQGYILSHGRRDLPSLLALVDLLDRYSLEAQRMVTLPLVREVMRMTQETHGES